MSTGLVEQVLGYAGAEAELPRTGPSMRTSGSLVIGDAAALARGTTAPELTVVERRAATAYAVHRLDDGSPLTTVGDPDLVERWQAVSASITTASGLVALVDGGLRRKVTRLLRRQEHWNRLTVAARMQPLVPIVNKGAVVGVVVTLPAGEHTVWHGLDAEERTVALGLAV